MVLIRTFTMNQSVAMIQEVFSKHIEPVAKDYMKGDIPQILLSIHRQGTKDKDWLAQVRLKETPTVSLFRCDIYLDDIHRLCRQCRIYLQTEEIFPVILLWFTLHPLYQSQFNDFTADLVSDYNAMMIGAAKQTYRYINNHYSRRNLFRRNALDILYYNMLMYADYPDPDLERKLKRSTGLYQKYCLENYRDAYNVASLRRAHNCMVDSEGMIIVERLRKKE